MEGEPPRVANAIPSVNNIIEHDSLFAYLANIQDAVLDGPLTSRSPLAKLYLYNDDEFPHNRLLRDVSGLSTFAIRTKVHIGDVNRGVAVTTVPALNGGGYQDCRIYTRFVNCLTAPAIRLEARFRKRYGVKSMVFHKLVLDFHFNDCEGKQLFDFASRPDAPGRNLSINFIANGATCEGMNISRELSITQRAVLNTLRSLVASGTRQSLHLELLARSAPASDVAALKQVLQRLPGGSGPLLRTIGCPEYHNFAPDFQSTLNPLSLLQRSPPLPFVPLYSGDTFASMRDYEAQQRNAISSPYYEQQKNLELFAKCTDHKVVLYKVEDFVVIAMNLDPYMRRLGGSDSAKFSRFPKEMEIKLNLRFRAPEGQEDDFLTNIVAHHEPLTMSLPKHDAYFVVTSHDPKLFQRFLCTPGHCPPRTCKVYKLEPHRNLYLYKSLQDALGAFTRGDKFAHLHQIILNQLHDGIPVINFTNGLSASTDTLDDAKNWLRSCRLWNKEQLQAIEDMHAAKGRLQIITGVAGTGKTTLQIAQALYMVKMGGRALCTATGNSNADHWAREAHELIAETFNLGIRAYRLYPASRGVNIKTLQKAQVKWKRAGHARGGRTSSLEDLMFRLFDENNSDFDFSIEKAVLEEAEKGQLSYNFRPDARIPLKVNAWEHLRSYMKKIQKGEFQWRNGSSDVRGLDRIYEVCKGHLVALADIIITTNGNARCSELREYWGRAEALFGSHNSEVYPQVQPIPALGVFIDEAGKEQEINIINTLTSPGLFRKPDIVILYGDDRQLGPVNTCSSEKFQIALYLDRLNISLLSRLINQGFPHNKLLEQHRMHPAISKNPNEMFYDGMLIDAPAVKCDLNSALPGFSTILHNIVAQSFSAGAPRAAYLQNATDAQARLHWIEMAVAKVSFVKGSQAILDHINLFFDKIFPQLQKYFGKRMHKEVMIIAAYSNALNQYENRFSEHRKRHPLLDISSYPRVLTVDASQGQEANMVIVDGSMQYADKMSPFLQDRGRANVAMTRAKHVLWILGGPMGIKDRRNSDMKPSPFVRLKRRLGLAGQVHRFS
ncbi:hypothetical protein CKM354_000185100 [Cercospora kikuchii]|uniref:DNA2/NAM7 helicase-like C-terminal domain-containing protein n=1 Tax=Cercospora kikuchii TaxID=84275 RepID=A0A9P3C8N9_9PEZI|nr:uncharacterized protein CKM354_000185100 [Cercospora kikuchii]GIZ38434.1 hypothetical protein CKM354_000185100 [Cercospora kikuchii]